MVIPAPSSRRERGDDLYLYLKEISLKPVKRIVAVVTDLMVTGDKSCDCHDGDG